MGNRVLVEALKKLKDKNLFDDIILAAPDIDADYFKEDCLPYIVSTNAIITLYASSNDKALRLSKILHGNYVRAGDAGASIVVYNGLETVDATQVDTDLIGHSYYGDNRSVITDLSQLIDHQRNLRPSQSDGLPFWIMPQ